MKDVHTEHCCIVHGCKYGDKDCTVTIGHGKQSYPCESCYFEGIRNMDQFNAVRNGMQKTCPHCKHILEN